MHEGRGIAARLVVEKLRGLEIEMLRVKVVSLLKVSYAYSKVSHFVDGSRPLLESLGLVDGSMFRVWLHAVF